MRLFLLAALTMTAFAANSVLNRWAVGGGMMAPVDFAHVRLLSGTAMLAVLLLMRRVALGGALGPGPLLLRAIGAASLLTYLLGFSLAYTALDAGAGALILFGMVQITMFAGALALREAVPARRWAGSVAAFLGLVYLLSPGSGAGDAPGAAALMVLAGIGWGVYSLAARGASDPLAATGWNFALAVPLMLLAEAFLPAAGTTAEGAGLILAVTSGAITSALGYALWYAVLPGLGASRAAVAQLTVPVIAMAGGMILLAEPLTLRFVIAAVLVLGGVALAVTAPRR